MKFVFSFMAFVINIRGLTDLIECSRKHELPHPSCELLPHEREEALLEDTQAERIEAYDGIDPGPHCNDRSRLQDLTALHSVSSC